MSNKDFNKLCVEFFFFFFLRVILNFTLIVINYYLEVMNNNVKVGRHFRQARQRFKRKSETATAAK